MALNVRNRPAEWLVRMPARPWPISPETLVRFRLSDPEAAAREISDLLEGVFGPFEPEAAMIWGLLDDEELSAQETATIFRAAAEADDPLACLGERSSTARARLNAWMRMRWAARDARAAGHPSSLVGLTWSSLSDNAREMVREGLLHLARHEAAWVRKGAPAKNRTDTVIDGLAEIYARYTGFTEHHQALPHAKRSHFIQFVLTILGPHLPPTELEPGAISKRWKRFKEKHGFDRNSDE